MNLKMNSAYSPFLKVCQIFGQTEPFPFKVALCSPCMSAFYF